MRVLLPLLFLACFACKAAPLPQSTVSEPRFHWESPGLFDAYVPSGEELQLVDEGRLAVSPSRAFSIGYSPEGTRAAELHQRCPTDRLLDVVHWKAGLVWLRADKYGNLWIDADVGSGSEPFPSPDRALELRKGWRFYPISDPPPRLAADGEVLVLFEAPWIHCYENGAWTSVPLVLGQEKLVRPPGRALLVGRKLWLGVDKGEWGGQLIVADIDSGLGQLESRKWPRGPTNVKDLDRGSDGRIYVTCGNAHLGLESSVLHVWDGTSWATELWSKFEFGDESFDGNRQDSTDDSPRFVRYSDEERIARLRQFMLAHAGEHRVPHANFTALAFDEQDRPCVLTFALGLFRRDASGRWEWLTPGWPRNGAWITDLAIVDKKAVITSRDAGVIVVDLETLAAERARLE